MALKQQLWKSSHCKIMYKISPPNETSYRQNSGLTSQPSQGTWMMLTGVN